MERALLLIGKLEERTNAESYQIYISNCCMSAIYEPFRDRDLFFDSLTDIFVSKIIEQNKILDLGIINGRRINPKTQVCEQIPALDSYFVDRINGIIKSKFYLKSLGLCPFLCTN